MGVGYRSLELPERKRKEYRRRGGRNLKSFVTTVGGVNPCCSHCRLAQFRGLTYGGKYSDVIGLKEPIA